MIESFFPTLIYSEDLSPLFDSDFNNNIYKKYLQLKKHNESARGWNCDTWNSSDIRDDMLLSNLFTTCHEHVDQFSENFNINKEYKLKLHSSWINIASPGCYQERHNHHSSHFSLVYYVKLPENSGSIVFYSHESDSMFPIMWEKANINNVNTIEYRPKESYILIFKSNISHMVMKNKSYDDRVSIAMNFTLL
jgi:uncharacterized protein (TIGR02466 family)